MAKSELKHLERDLAETDILIQILEHEALSHRNDLKLLVLRLQKDLILSQIEKLQRLETDKSNSKSIQRWLSQRKPS